MIIENGYEIEKIHENELQNTALGLSKYHSHLIHPLFIEYQIAYNDNSIFENCSLKIKTKNNNIILPMTIEFKDNIKELNFYNFPITIHCSNEINEQDNNILKKILENFCFKNNISKYKICFKKTNPLEAALKNNFYLITKKIFINCLDSKEKIYMNFKPNLRNELKKNYGNTPLNYRLIDHTNYKNEIIKMKQLHQKVVGFQTRSDKSWAVNEKMILNKNAFLLEVTLNEESISYSLFQINNTICNYFSSCTKRDLFKIYRNINHKSIWHAIKYAVNKTKFFFLGEIKIFSKKPLSEKEKNIDFFFSRFSQPINNYYYSDSLNYLDFS